jgi:hypothetical protein
MEIVHADLAEWLLAQIASDERSFALSDRDLAFGLVSGGTEDGRIVALQERLLDECRAKNRLVEIVVRMTDPRWATYSVTQDATMALKLLALPYDDREGYLEEWRP